MRPEHFVPNPQNSYPHPQKWTVHLCFLAIRPYTVAHKRLPVKQKFLPNAFIFSYFHRFTIS